MCGGSLELILQPETKCLLRKNNLNDSAFNLSENL